MVCHHLQKQRVRGSSCRWLYNNQRFPEQPPSAHSVVQTAPHLRRNSSGVACVTATVYTKQRVHVKGGIRSEAIGLDTVGSAICIAYDSGLQI